jgi:subtilisin family serine protease
VRYIVVPKFDEIAETLADSTDRLDPQSRLERYGELARLRRTAFESIAPDFGFQLESAARDIAGPDREVKVVATPRTETIATGVTIIDTDEESAAAINSQLESVDVIPDEDLALISPDAGTSQITAASSDLTDAELWHIEAIGLKGARASGFTGTGSGITVAVLDTGIEDVPEIQGKVTHAVELDTTAWKANSLPTTKDTHGHGTHVAGLIAGDTVGVAPGARLANVIMIPGSTGKISDYILALEWVASQPQIAIISMSAGRHGFQEHMRIMTRVLKRVRTLAVMAIGNEGPNTSRSPGNYPEVISVGASNVNKKIWSSSGGGTLVIDQMSMSAPKLVAPGEGVTSCVMQGGYQSWNGTSMATPIVSGIACLMLERFSNISLADLENELLAACVDLGLPVERQGRGQAHLPSSLAVAVA